MNKRNMSIVVIALLAVAAAGYWAWERKQTTLEQAAVLDLMDSAGVALQAGLLPAADPASQSAAIGAAVRRVDEDAAALRALSVDRVPALSEAVAAYLDTARELAKRRAIIAALEPQVRQDLDEFRRHMRDRSGADWTSVAARLKNRLEENFREYQRTVETHTRLSDGYAEEFERLAALVPHGSVVPVEAVAAVRDRVAAQGHSASVEMEALRRMTAPQS